MQPMLFTCWTTVVMVIVLAPNNQTKTMMARWLVVMLYLRVHYGQ